MKNEKNANMNTVRDLRRRYILALTIIGAILVLSQMIIQFVLLTQYGDSRVVNLAGLQRMLSQRISKCALIIIENKNAENRLVTVKELDESIALWERTHVGLQMGDEALGLPALKSKKAALMFAGIEGNYRIILANGKELSAQVKKGTTDENSLGILLDRIIENESLFLKGMDEIVFTLDSEASEKVNAIRFIEGILFIMAIITLCLEAYFIFWPAEAQIKRAMDILVANEDNIKKLFDIAPAPMLLVSTNDYSIVRLNQMASDTLQMNFDEAIGRKLYDFISSEYLGVLEVMEDQSYDGQIRKVEVILRDAYGSSYYMLMSVARISYYDRMIFLIGFSDFTDIKKKEANLERLATIDEMTGLTNRRTGIAILEKQIELCRRERIGLSFCFIDLDGLKSVNDIFGHTEGDWFIKNIASVLARNARSEDTVFRYGGDEMAIVFVSCDEECSRMAMERATREINEINLSSGKPYKISFSYGIESCHGDEDFTLESLVNAADEKMYKQKQGKKLNKKFHV